jgi:hypothetical protein
LDEVTVSAAKPILSIELLGGFGQTITRYAPVINRRELQLSLEGLPAGAYLLRISFRGGVVYRKLVVAE